jgi:DNA mismatch endonuclease (patch repair protein)
MRNAEFWSAKFQRNVERDREAREALSRLGFRVLTLWQCEAESPETLAARLEPFSTVAITPVGEYN